jgi:hypothetical protein
MIAASEIKPALTTKKSILPFDFTAQEKLTSSTSEMATIAFEFSNITSTSSFIFDAQPALMDRPMRLQKKHEKNIWFEKTHIKARPDVSQKTSKNMFCGKYTMFDETMSL